MRYFHGRGNVYPYFEGWYLKHQCDNRTVAFIPAVHTDEKGHKTASVQVITDDGTWNFPYSVDECRIGRKRFRVKMGDNIFSEKGIQVNLKNNEIEIKGKVHYSEFCTLKKDIMGPFRFVPMMQCNHGVISMMHELKGEIVFSHKKINLTGGAGYVETDWGRSFPEKYLWTQCGFEDRGRNSVMLSVADIPMPGRSFCGCICAIMYRDREYRMATYRGVRIQKWEDGEVVIRQRHLCLKVSKLGDRSYGLRAPVKGKMSRIIKESPACRVRYQFWNKGELVFDITSSQASFELVK